jgi:hypothetical protein
LRRWCLLRYRLHRHVQGLQPAELARRVQPSARRSATQQFIAMSRGQGAYLRAGRNLRRRGSLSQVCERNRVQAGNMRGGFHHRRADVRRERLLFAELDQPLLSVYLRSDDESVRD